MALPVAIIALSLTSEPLNLSPHTEKERNVFSALKDRDIYRCGNFARLKNQLFSPILDEKSLVCELTNGLSVNSPILLFIGDSHADSIKKTFTSVAAKNGYRMFFMASNVPLVGRPGKKQMLDLIKTLKPNAVILHFSVGANAQKAYASGFLEDSRAAGFPTIWLLPVPTFSEGIPKLIWDNFSSGTNFHPLPGNIKETSALKKQLTGNGVKTFDAYPAFCAEQCDVVDAAMRPFYFDSNHLTLTGAERLRPVFEEIMDWLILNPS